MNNRVCKFLSLTSVAIVLQACSLPQAIGYNITHSLGAKAPQSAPSIAHEKRKIGKPYSEKNEHGNRVWYSPLQSSEGYRVYGVASWYGKDFHAKKTANGEDYNMYAYTAAHKTLPLPTYVRVTNTDSGKSIVVRVNDRGPFYKNRLIDLSYAGAKALGFDKQGTANVLVEAISVHGGDVRKSVYKQAKPAPAYQQQRRYSNYQPKPQPTQPQRSFTSRYSNTGSYQAQNSYNAGSGSSFTTRIANRDRAVNTATTSQVAPRAAGVMPSAVSGDFIIQIASFSDVNNARKMYYKASKSIKGVKITSVPINGQTYYRVVVENRDDSKQIEQLLIEVKDKGFYNAIITKNK